MIDKGWKALGLAAAAVLVGGGLSAWSKTAMRHVDNNVKRVGRIAGWHVASDGAVALRLVERTRQKEPASAWFRTPASTTTNTRFEHLVLSILLDAEGRSTSAPKLIPVDKRLPKPIPPVYTVRVTGERVGDADGSSVEKAYVLETISRNLR